MQGRMTDRRLSVSSRLADWLSELRWFAADNARGLGRPDLVLLAVILVLLVLGIDMVYSASFAIAENSPEYQNESYFAVRQVIWVVGGLAAMLIIMNIDYHKLSKLSVPFLLCVLVLLLVVATPFGHSEYGSQRWLSLGPLPAIQPSEFAKLAIIIYFADWLSRRPGRAAGLASGALPFAVVISTVGGLVLAQKDLGSAFVIVLTGVCLFFVGGANMRHFVVGLIGGGIALACAVLLTGYRTDRLDAFIDPMKDPLGVGWHTIQTNIALGSGGIFGLGLGASRQKFFWLPAAHTDAIFAVIGEEIGFVGAVLVVVLFLLLGLRGLKTMMNAPDAFGALLAGGITLWVVLQAIVNMAAVTSLIPFTGITLPFLSSGGSSVTITLVGMGILLNISRQQARQQTSRARNRRPAG